MGGLDPKISQSPFQPYNLWIIHSTMKDVCTHWILYTCKLGTGILQSGFKLAIKIRIEMPRSVIMTFSFTGHDGSIEANNQEGHLANYVPCNIQISSNCKSNFQDQEGLRAFHENTLYEQL